jgi:hypothetical protein
LPFLLLGIDCLRVGIQIRANELFFCKESIRIKLSAVIIKGGGRGARGFPAARTNAHPDEMGFAMLSTSQRNLSERIPNPGQCCFCATQIHPGLKIAIRHFADIHTEDGSPKKGKVMSADFPFD